MTNVTNRYKLFPAETLKGIWGSCGAHHNTYGLTAASGLPLPSWKQARRVGRNPSVVFLGIWGSSWERLVLGHLETFFHLDVVSEDGVTQFMRKGLLSCERGIIKH